MKTSVFKPLVHSNMTPTPFDPSEFLDSEEAIKDYLSIALEDYDSKTFQSVLGTIARARGMTDLAKKTGLGRESLYKALSPQGNPSFENICKIMKALDLKLVAGSLNPQSHQ